MDEMGGCWGGLVARIGLVIPCPIAGLLPSSHYLECLAGLLARVDVAGVVGGGQGDARGVELGGVAVLGHLLRAPESVTCRLIRARMGTRAQEHTGT